VNRVVAHRETYIDSVVLLTATRAMGASAGVSFATAVMATPANVADLRDAGFDDAALASASANDLLLAVAADDTDACDRAVAAGEEVVFARRPRVEATEFRRARTLEAAVDLRPDVNVAVVSVPGPYAAVEAHKALGRGLHVLLFSDNVPVEEEIELKERAARMGRLVMGPGAGTAVLGGCGLGFANVVRPGRVGVVAAAGTGAQEVMCLLDRWDEGVSHVIGVGGRDLTGDVGGRMAAEAVRALDVDPGTEVILLVSKPPDVDVARAVIAAATATPVVAATIGTGDGATLENGVVQTLRRLGRLAPDLSGTMVDEVEQAIDGLSPHRTVIHGLFSGGTLCYEALAVLGRVVGPVYSNIPLDPRHGVPAPDGAHVCLDLGEEEYTRGRPHPMIDPEARLALIDAAGKRGDVAVVLVDVVLGHGAHDDPAGAIAEVSERITPGGGPVVVAHVVGTPDDPQGLDGQERRLRDAGCIVAPTGAQAALAAAAIARRNPAMLGGNRRYSDDNHPTFGDGDG
jgi:FdrA protein